MLRKPSLVVAVVSAILALHYILKAFEVPEIITGLIFILSPFLIIWMVYTVIRYGEYNGKEFYKEEDWGYEDKNKNDTSTF